MNYSDMNALQRCVVKELETCEESTPANLVESMFKFVRNETPCANMTVSIFFLSIKIRIIGQLVFGVVRMFTPIERFAESEGKSMRTTVLSIDSIKVFY